MARILPFLLIVVVSTGGAIRGYSQPAFDDVAKQFVGVWRLLSWTSQSADGTSTRERVTVGYLIYTEGGHMCWTGMDPDRPQWESADNPTRAELASAYFGTAAYCSTVEIHADDGFVLHHVESAIWPGATGSTLRRAFEFDGPNRLTLSYPVPAPPGAVHILVWERIE